MKEKYMEQRLLCTAVAGFKSVWFGNVQFKNVWFKSGNSSKWKLLQALRHHLIWEHA